MNSSAFSIIRATVLDGIDRFNPLSRGWALFRRIDELKIAQFAERVSDGTVCDVIEVREKRWNIRLFRVSSGKLDGCIVPLSKVLIEEQWRRRDIS